MLELTGVTQRHFDKHDRLVGPKPMSLPNLCILGGTIVDTRPMRHEYGYFKVSQSIPEKPGVIIAEIKAFESQFHAAARA